MNDINTKDLSSRYFKTFMRFRKQTIVEIAEHTGISKRTIQGYAQGRPPFRNAPATNFMAITDYMEIDPHYMLGLEEWKLSDYLKSILEENELKSFTDTRYLRPTIRLTGATRKYRKEKAMLRKFESRLKEISPDVYHKIKEKEPVTAKPSTYNQDVDIVLKFDDSREEGLTDESKERVRAYIEVLRYIESACDSDEEKKE